MRKPYVKIRENSLYSFELRLLTLGLTLGDFEWIVRRLRSSPGLALILLGIPFLVAGRSRS